MTMINSQDSKENLAKNTIEIIGKTLKKSN